MNTVERPLNVTEFRGKVKAGDSLGEPKASIRRVGRSRLPRSGSTGRSTRGNNRRRWNVDVYLSEQGRRPLDVPRSRFNLTGFLPEFLCGCALTRDKRP